MGIFGRVRFATRAVVSSKHESEASPWHMLHTIFIDLNVHFETLSWGKRKFCSKSAGAGACKSKCLECTYVMGKKVTF